MSPVISRVTNQYSLRVPAHRYSQGGRNVYYFAMDFDTLDGLLPRRVDDSVVREANRRLTPSHAQNIQSYLERQDNWLLGALMLGIAPDAVEFDPYPAAPGETSNDNFGELRIRTNRANTMRIFDGQHRRRAIQEVLAQLADRSDQRAVEKASSLRKACMTIILYAEDDIGTLRQMFVDASKTKPIEANTVVRFDQRDAFSQVSVRLAEDSRLFGGRVEMESSSVTATSPHLLAVNQLATVLKSLMVGYGGRVSRDRNDSYLLDLDSLSQQCRVWTEEFMPAARPEYSDLVHGEIETSEIPRLRAASFAYNVTFIRVLAGCYYLWMNEYRSWATLADFISRASIGHGSDHGLLVDASLVSPSGATLFARRQEVARAINYIVTAAKQGGSL